MKNSNGLRIPTLFRLWIPTLFFGLFACSHTGSQVANDTAVACFAPRPQVCTQDYLPVCASRDNGTRCITTPCPSTDLVTFANACTACSDPNVISYQAGQCPP